MPYIDDADKRIQEQMKQEGKIIIPNFNEIIEKHFKFQHNKDGYFRFLYVEYEFYDTNYEIYNLDLGQYVARPQNRKIKTMLPFFIEPNSIDDIRMFCLKIPNIIDISDLDLKISEHSPAGITFINEDKMKAILTNEGYQDPFFDHYFYNQMDYPECNVYAKPITNKKTR